MTFDGHELLIRSTMAELTANFAAGTPIEHTLASVTAAAVQLISGVDCADVLLIKDGEHQSIAATSEVAPKVDAAQRRTGEGPCLDAAGLAGMIRCDNLAEDARWPRFAAAAIPAGVHSVLSFHLYSHGADTGALNLFGYHARRFNAESDAVGAMLATHAATALIAANRQHQFEWALASRDVIGQAKGIIMERCDLDAVRAFEMLTRMSQNSNTPIAVIAGEIAQRSGYRYRSTAVAP